MPAVQLFTCLPVGLPARLLTRVSLQATAVIAMLEKRAGEDLFRKHVGNVVAAGITALQAEQAATSGAGAGRASKATAPAASPAAAAFPAGGAVPAGSPMQPGAAAAAEAANSGTRLLDTMTFLTDLGRWAGES
jgi:hypothetical protein